MRKVQNHCCFCPPVTIVMFMMFLYIYLYISLSILCVFCEGWAGSVKSLRPRIRLPGRVSVGVQLVICASTQHQLKIENGRKKQRRFLMHCWHDVLKFPLDHDCSLLWDCIYRKKQSYPTFCPVHTKHFVFMGCQVIQRSLKAVTHQRNTR